MLASVLDYFFLSDMLALGKLAGVFCLFFFYFILFLNIMKGCLCDTKGS